MYVSEIIFKNYGPMSDVNFDTGINENINPKPIVLIGQNGTGKTLFLSSILNAIIEFKRKKYNILKEVSDNNLYMVDSHDYIPPNCSVAYNQINFTNSFAYTKCIIANYQRTKENFSSKDYPNVDINDERLAKTGFYTNIFSPDSNIFDKEIFLYFPVERFYIPTWLNINNKNLNYSFGDKKVVGESSSNTINSDVLSNIEQWLLDVKIDQQLFEGNVSIDLMNLIPQFTTCGRNTNIIKAINYILTTIYRNKGYESVSLVISKRFGLYRRIGLQGIKGNDTKEFLPHITNMSSGEAMIFGLMASILREADKVQNLDDPKGIVLIDEVDAHLHSDLLHDVLPKLIKFFPKIQFIVSSHSSFFLLGMKEIFADECTFLELPSGKNVSNIIDFQEIRNCFSVINREYLCVLDSYNNILKEISEMKKPLIITEGKTDWKHLSAALSFFHSQNMFKDVDVSFLQYDEDMGCDKLERMLKELSIISHHFPVIGIFDNDSKLGEQYEAYCKLGKNTYACSIKGTLSYGKKISIELLYKESDLKKIRSDGKRLFLSTEFTERSHRLIADSTIVCQNHSLIDAKKRGLTKIIDGEVFNKDENNIALSKNEFAEMVYKNEAPYRDLDREGFVDIFNTIKSILENIRDGI